MSAQCYICEAAAERAETSQCGDHPEADYIPDQLAIPRVADVAPPPHSWADDAPTVRVLGHTEFWTVFHRAWGRAHESPEYEKQDWRLLMRTVEDLFTRRDMEEC